MTYGQYTPIETMKKSKCSVDAATSNNLGLNNKTTKKSKEQLCQINCTTASIKNWKVMGLKMVPVQPPMCFAPGTGKRDFSDQYFIPNTHSKKLVI